MRSPSARLAAIGTLIGVVAATGLILLYPAGGGHRYELILQTSGQLVKGNQVKIGGQPVGEITSIELTDDSQAEVEIETDRELHEGTTAIVRATSLSGVANRYVALTPGPNNFPVLGEGETIAVDKTTAPVDLDQLFNSLDEPARKSIQNVIKGSASAYSGVTREANDTYRYLNPSLVATDKLLQELARDERTLSDFVVHTSRVVTALAGKRAELASLVPNTNRALGAVAQQHRSLDLALRSLPPALHQANATFSELRGTLDQVDPLVDEADAGTRGLAGFLARARPTIDRAVPVFADLGTAVRGAEASDDLAEFAADLPGLQNAAGSARQPALDAMGESEPVLSFARPYMPDLLGAVTKLGQVTAYYDADGHYARVMPAGLGLFTHNTLTQGLEPIPPAQQFDDLDFGIFRRCPGGSSQPAVDLSSVFLDTGGLGLSDCDPADVPPGP